ncbi:MAG TPA: hypothetical protein VLH86_00920 [Patescibacteria group bacterium]|nr:hypothetical protein [Patescibacteria group bacterium]
MHAYYGQSPGQGYFSGSGSDTSGWEVLNVSCSTGGEYGPYNYNNGNTYCNAIPRDLNSAGEFIAFIEGRLANGIPNGSYGFSTGTYGDPRAKTGAAVIVHTMLGTPTGQRNRPPTAAQLAAWEDLVNDYAAAGRINWNTQAYTFGVNSLYQGTDNTPSPNDVTFYAASVDGASIVFTAPNGAQYAVRRECGNPVGGTSLPQLANFSTSGRVTVNNSTPRPGDTIQFQYYVKNNGPTDTSPTPIWWVAINTANGGAVGGAASSGTYASGQEKNVFTENYTVPAGTAPNTQICRQTGWDPVNSSGARDGRSAIVCATVRYDFTLTPTINIDINDGATTGSAVEVGDKLEFIYAVNNVGTTVSMNTACTVYGLSKTGYAVVPTPNDRTSDVGFVQPATGCPRTFPANANTTLVTETIAAVPATSLNKTLCRTLLVNPANPAGADATAEVCVAVTAKPYLRVYGGDVSAGNGFASGAGSSTCSNNSGAAIVSWNRGSASGYAGSGVQFAAMALSEINDFSTALGNTSGAPKPSGLAFANTAPSGSNFGGSFGAVTCVPDRYAEKPAGAPGGSSNVGNMATGVYALTGPTTLGGTIGSNFSGTPQQVLLYVDGDVLIDNNIQYPASWTSGNPPLFVLVARGNIFVSQSVTTLNGTFVAQPNGSAGGIIYTCANPALPATAVSQAFATFYSTCKNKLTVNGAFVARQVRFLRTNGTLSQSTAGETSATGFGGEVFNYGPANWMVMPPSATTDSDYDAITGLPPVL